MSMISEKKLGRLCLKVHMTRRFRQPLVAMLSIVVAAASMLPPAVCHAHEAGDRGHSHRLADAGRCDDGSHHACGHHHRGSDHASHTDHRHGGRDGRNSERGLETPVAHVHYLVFGFDFPLPVPIDDEEPLFPTSDDLVSVRVVRLTDDFTVTSQTDLTCVIDVSLAYSLTTAVSAGEDDAAARWLRSRVDRVLLSDSVRCERSGVLLI